MRSDLMKDGLGDMIRAIEREMKRVESVSETDAASASSDLVAGRRGSAATPKSGKKAGRAETPSSRGKRSKTPVSSSTRRSSSRSRKSTGRSGSRGRRRRSSVSVATEVESEEQDASEEEEEGGERMVDAVVAAAEDFEMSGDGEEDRVGLPARVDGQTMSLLWGVSALVVLLDRVKTHSPVKEVVEATGLGRVPHVAMVASVVAAIASILFLLDLPHRNAFWARRYVRYCALYLVVEALHTAVLEVPSAQGSEILQAIFHYLPPLFLMLGWAAQEDADSAAARELTSDVPSPIGGLAAFVLGTLIHWVSSTGINAAWTAVSASAEKHWNDTLNIFAQDSIQAMFGSAFSCTQHFVSTNITYGITNWNSILVTLFWGATLAFAIRRVAAKPQNSTRIAGLVAVLALHGSIQHHLTAALAQVIQTLSSLPHAQALQIVGPQSNSPSLITLIGWATLAAAGAQD